MHSFVRRMLRLNLRYAVTMKCQKNNFAKLLILLSCTCLSACQLVERSTIPSLHITEVYSDKSIHLHIRAAGSRNSAAVGFGELRSEIVGDEMRLMTEERFIGDGQPFDYVVTLPANVKRVVLGSMRKEIWPVDEGASKYSDDEKKALAVAAKAFQIGKPELDLDDFREQIDSTYGAPDAGDQYTILFVRDGPTHPSVCDMYHYSVKKSDFSVAYTGKSYAGQALLLEQLGKKDKPVPSNEIEFRKIDLEEEKGVNPHAGGNAQNER